ncbi:hypothetical protein DPMN_182867 [Dreissena polymorpha]|uniref:Mitochondrial assembly of ribosomal large subunit protein 1 n=2 Tax=Dreissena polymorpha TaxID=45954 RepID=A0A9D4I6J4_DREPO|nr:hypothetical protein DPMN_182867 [Dreissena polymorpha]
MSLCRCDGVSFVKRFLSSGSDSADYKNDKEVQSLLQDIREDFNRELNQISSNKSSNTHKGDDEHKVENDGEIEKYEKLGYTTEEYIAMLKERRETSLNVGTLHVQGINNEDDDADLHSDSSSSDSDSDSSSSSSSDSDDDNNGGSGGGNDNSNKKSNKIVKEKNSSLEKEKTDIKVFSKPEAKQSLKASANKSEIEISELSEDGIVGKTESEVLHAGRYRIGSENPDSVVVLSYPEDDNLPGTIKAAGKGSTVAPDTGRMWSDVEIEDFVNIVQPEPDVAQPWQAPIPLTRGKTGVFDVEDLVTLLESINAADIVTIRISPDLNFADYMVIVSANSNRHLRAMGEDLKWTYKRKRGYKDRPYVRVHGEDTEWCCLDLGNIVLHMFMPDVREKYDLETLWTVGPKFDPKCVEEADPYTFSEEELPWLRDLESKNEQQLEGNNEQHLKEQMIKVGRKKEQHLEENLSNVGMKNEGHLEEKISNIRRKKRATYGGKNKQLSEGKSG